VPKDTESPFLRQLGKRIKELREKRELSQEALSRASGVHRVYISGIERGIRNLTVLHLVSIAKALKIRPGALLDE
jgi:transcriptional regulator with XRE-family HTH domain